MPSRMIRLEIAPWIPVRMSKMYNNSLQFLKGRDGLSISVQLELQIV
jgi:hypothetical protein